MTQAQHVCMVVTTDFVHDRRVRKEARSVLDMGFDLTVIATARPEDVLYGQGTGIEEEFPDSNFRFAPVDLPRRGRGLANPILSKIVTLIWAMFAYLKIMWAVFRVRADLYHCHDIDGLALARLPALLHRGKVIFDCHDIMSDIQIAGSVLARLRPVIAFFERRLPQTAHGVIAAAPSFARRVAADTGLDVQTIVPVLNCPRLHEFAPNNRLHMAFDLPKGAPVLLYLGSLNPDRGLAQLINVIDDLDETIQIVLLGPGHDSVRQELAQRIAQTRTDARVHMGGFVALDDVPATLMAADATIIPNTYVSEAYNSLPNKLFEAMMAGRPFVCHDIPEMAKIVRAENCGLVMPDEQPATVATVLNRLLTEPGLAAELGTNGRRAATETYNWDAQAAQIKSLYDRVLGMVA